MLIWFKPPTPERKKGERERERTPSERKKRKRERKKKREKRKKKKKARERERERHRTVDVVTGSIKSRSRLHKANPCKLNRWLSHCSERRARAPRECVVTRPYNSIALPRPAGVTRLGAGWLVAGHNNKTAT